VLGLLVLGLNAVAVLTLDQINGTVVGFVAAVDLNVGFGVRGTRLVLLEVELFTDAGTAVTFFFTGYTDLFFAEAMLSGEAMFSGMSMRRKVGVDSERRELTFPSGFVLLREFDLKLFVSVLDSLLLVGVLVGAWEDAEGNGNSGFKVQVDDLPERKICLLDDLPTRRKEDKKIPLASFLEKLKEMEKKRRI
jgi:hypothetical protein